METNFEIQLKTFSGLEEILAKEVLQLGGKNVAIKKRAVTCEGDLGFLYKANFSLRTALKIIKPIYKFKASNIETFYRKLLDFAWENYFSASQTFLIDATIHSEYFTHSQFVTLKMKDAIADRFRNKYHKRPDVDTQNPDVKFNLHIDNEWITISLDSSGEPLFKRGYRIANITAPINEVLAAGILHLAQFSGKENFLDPMCGSGTFLIEAAMIAANIPPQIHRKEFGFMKWNDFDNELWQKIQQFRLDKIRDFNNKIVGYDIDERALSAAKGNIQSANMEDFIELKKLNFFDSRKEISPLIIVFNPPYDERLAINQKDFYQNIGDTLKQNYPNTFSWFITSDLSAEKQVGLRPSRKIKLYNGKLECKLLRYDVYEGSKKSKLTLE